MPFAKNNIEPTRLSRGRLGTDYKFDLDCISNNTLGGLLRQLSSLAKRADTIFTEIAEECVCVVNKTQRIRNRIGEITKHVDKLNAKAVTVPVGDLASFAHHSNHYQAEHGFDCYLFSPASRPEALVHLYDKSAPSPLSTIRRCNLLRSDGKTGSKYFSPALIINDEKFEDVETHLSFRKPPVVKFRKSVQVLQIERETKELKGPRIQDRPHSMSVLTELDLTLNSGCSTLPTPEQKLREISRSQPVTLVPIDVTGSSFNRMCDYRSSIRSINTQYEVLEDSVRSSSSAARRKQRRRQTLSGIPGFVFAEISTDAYKVGTLRTRSVSRERWERPRSMALEGSSSSRRGRSRERKRERGHHNNDESRADSPVSKSCSLRRSFRSLFKGSRSRSQDLWAEGRPRSPGPPMIDLNVPLRRSRSLPRSLRSVMRETSSSRLESGGRSASTEGRLDGWTEAELTERDIPWVRGKPPAAPGSRAVRAPRLPRSRSQNVARRRSAYVVDSSDDSSTTGVAPPVVRPQSLRTSLSQGQLRLPIPVSMPTTPSTESLTSSAADSAQRMNIPAGGAAWEPFASVRLRQHAKGQTPDDRQSSSGNWSASSSSARQSLESDYNRLINSPEKRSQTSLDKDSALSLNIHSSSEDRYTTDNNGDMGEETSTLTGDTSTLNGETATEDTSTVNGDVDSVIDVKANFTKMNTEDWLNSLKRDKRTSRRKSRHEHENGSGLTQQNLRAHDHAHKPFVRSLSRLPDEESSVYSVDQEGFYTSMHRDSGLKRSQSEMIQEETQWQLSMDSFMSSSNSTLASTMPTTSKPSRAEKVRRRSTSFLANLPGLKKIKSAAKNKKKTPPPPPRRVSTVLDKSNLTLHLEEPDSGPPATPSSELSKSADTSTETVINTGIQSPPPKSGHNDSSCESDAEAIYARLKTKTSISAAGIPSLCSVTPLCSDEEDSDMLSFSRSWRGHAVAGAGNDTSTWTGSLLSTKSAPGSLLDGVMITSTPLQSGGVRSRLESSGEKSGVDLSMSDTMMQVADSSGDSSGFSTWPRTPTSKGERKNEQKAPRPPRTLDFSPSGFDPRDARNIIPEAKTPEETLENRTLTARNSFRGSHDGSVGGSEKDGGSSKGTSSIYSPSNSSIPSSFSDDMPAMPGKYQPGVSVRPDPRGRSNDKLLTRPNDGKGTKKTGDVASLSGGSGGSACTSPVNKPSHVYANVVVQDNGPLSASSSASSISFGGSNTVLPTSSASSISECNNEYMSVTSTWPRSSKSNSEPVQEGKKTQKKRLSTFAKLEKEEKKDAEEEGQEEPLSVPVTSYNGPVPAPAKLIISSPVATKVSFRENPYKRSVCSPVTTHELMSFWNQSVKDKPYNNSPVCSALDGSDLSSQEPSPSAFKPVLPAPCPSTSQVVSRPLFPNLSSMKHSISFPVAAGKKEEKPEPTVTTPSAYGRSWYDGISSQATKNSEVVPITTPTPVTRTLSSLPSQVSLTSFVSDSPTPSLLDQRRDSISSNVSSDSGSRKHVTFATVNKASPASSQFSLKMDDGTSSLTGSITGSISSNDSRDKNPTFSSFSRLPTDTPTNSLQRGSTSGNLKGILNAPTPVTAPTEASSPLRPTGSSYLRPTSLALSKTVDTLSRLQSIGEGQPSEEFSNTTKTQTVVSTSIPARETDSNKKQLQTTHAASKATTVDKAKPVASIAASARSSHTLPAVKDWPAPSTNTGPNKAASQGSAVAKKGDPKTNTVSSLPKQPQTARVSPTIKSNVPKLSSFRPLSSNSKQSSPGPSNNPDKSPKRNSKSSKQDSGPKQSKDDAKQNVESPVKAVTNTSRLPNPSSVINKEGPTEGVQPCSTASPNRTVPERLATPGVSNTSSGDDKKSSQSEKVKIGGGESKPPTGPAAAKVSPRIGPVRPSVLATTSNNASSPSTSKYNSVLTSSTLSLTPSVGTNGSSGTLSTSALSLSSSSLQGSKLSLNKSTDSLASNSSTQSVIERNRAARLAFLNSGACQAASSGPPPPPEPASDPFKKYKTGESGPSTCTGTPPPPNSVDDRFARYKIGQRKSSTGSTSSGSGSPTSPTCTGPSQGRFVNSVINQLANKSGSESPPSPTTPSSGLGSSIASPQSPLKTLTPHSSPGKDLKSLKATGVVPPNNNNNNNINDTQANTSLNVGKKESCC